MPVTTKTIEIDHGWKAIKDRVHRLGDTGAICRIGVQGERGAANHQKSRLSVAQIADVQEYGRRIWQRKRQRWVIIPARSFMGKTVDIFADAIAKREAAFAYGVLIGKFDLRTALEAFGSYVVGLIQQRIADRILPKNSDYTIAKKGSDVPLIDSGQLRGSITYKIEGA
jgi:hypothetical protein